MAIPRVFISSTCYDLGQIRDSLSEFIASYYYESMLSEKGDIFYHPDLHTHESCINEVENCQLFILIIGGRFGGSYKYDIQKSITNAEYEAAKQKKIPVFTFVKKDLFDDHRLYQKNKNNKDIINKIEFPSIENQEYAVNIFEFINQVRLADVNNGLFPFEFVKDIKNCLGKQLAGLMFDFLNERNKDNNQKIVKNTLDNLTLINKKTEELLENILKSLNPKQGSQQIQNMDKILLGSKFFTHVLRMFNTIGFNDNKSKIGKTNPKKYTWYEYISQFEGFSLQEPVHEIDDGYDTALLLTRGPNSWSVVTRNEVYPKEVKEANELYEHFKTLNEKERLKAWEIITSANFFMTPNDKLVK